MEKVINGVSYRVVEKEWDVYFDMALTMFEEIVKNNQAGKPSVFIVPVGPTDQYPILAKLINSQRVSLKNVQLLQHGRVSGFSDPVDQRGRPHELPRPDEAGIL